MTDNGRLWEIAALALVKSKAHGRGVYTLPLFIDDGCYELRVVRPTPIPGFRKTRSRLKEVVRAVRSLLHVGPDDLPEGHCWLSRSDIAISLSAARRLSSQEG